ncbi:MAG: DUF559 domain-containing protein [Anaerolineae bacterium]|jgi:very-short-patch-repair endonuclease|nr:DUF559 domain-containing protein [Anaerolineae bacterium]
MSYDRKRNIVVNGYVNMDKKLRAKQLRQEMTPTENHLWQLLRREQLGGFHFRRQQVIDGFIVDFYCHKAGLVVELDGAIHLQQQQADAEREAALGKRGLTVIRFTNEEVLEDTQQVLQRILAYCRRLSE